MAAPWISSPKTLNLSDQTQHPHKLFPGSGFVPAPLKSSIRFTPSLLYAALAKTSALSSANIHVVAALVHSDQALIGAVVDDAGSDFLFTTDADHLGPDLRKALAGRIGAALCHIYMDQLGYAWLDYAGHYIRTALPLGDFLYDGASLGSRGLVLAEAKGSLKPKPSASRVKSVANAAYRRQVSTHLGVVTAAGRIEYACAIATAIVPADEWTQGQASCFLHVAETQPIQVAPGQGTQVSQGSADGDLAEVSCFLALRNYRAVFRLISAPYMVDFLDRLLAGLPLGGEFVQRFGRFRTDEEYTPWVVGEPHQHPSAHDYNNANHVAYGFSFGLHERSFRAILALIKRVAKNPELLGGTVRLPNLSNAETYGGEDGDRPRPDRPARWSKDLRAMLGDGLSVIGSSGRSFPDEENFSWPASE